MHLTQVHKPLPAQMLAPVQSVNCKELAAELLRLTGVRWSKNIAEQELWIKANDTVLTDIRDKLKTFDIEIKKEANKHIVLDARTLDLEKLKQLYVPEPPKPK